jgi:hypothetical protein
MRVESEYTTPPFHESFDRLGEGLFYAYTLE